MTQPKVLVVDDDPMNLDIIGEFLEDLHLDLGFAGCGEHAWDMLDADAEDYDLVILDRMMPGMSGIELLQRVKTDPRLVQLPVIFQTAAASPEQVREGLAAGAYYYLTKPFEPEALLAIVRAALNDAEARRELREFARRQSDVLRLMSHASFCLCTVEEAQHLAVLLSTLCPNPDASVIGLVELIVNAVEHGNLGITYAEKSQLRREGNWEVEVARRLSLAEHRHKQVRVSVERDATEVRFIIADHGAGFDWRAYLEFDPARAYDPNGRGIALARQLSFTRLDYRDPGNVVEATVALRDGERAEVATTSQREAAHV
jgi:CheY-like chemotaxis protein/anti-sigma regulatory factor (Ser/Thr protein kinase)